MRPWTVAILALLGLGSVHREHVVARLERGDARALLAQNATEQTLGVGARQREESVRQMPEALTSLRQRAGRRDRAFRWGGVGLPARRLRLKFLCLSIQ